MAELIPDKNSLKMNDPFHFQIICANKLIDDAMQNEEFARQLKEKREEALMYGGMSRCGSLKSKYSIPQDAWIVLPEEVRDDDKVLDEWIIKHHPYLIISNWKAKKGDRISTGMKLNRR